MNKYLVVLFILFFSCGSENDLKEEKLKPVKVLVPGETEVKSLQIDKIVPLETKDKSVFGQFYKVVLSDSGIYILDHIFTNNLYHFNENGNFITKLHIGKGPGEVIDTYSMYLDREAKQVYVYDGGSEVIKLFDDQLEYLRTLPINNEIAYHHFNKLSNNKWLVQANYKNYPENDTTALYVLLDKDFQQIQNKYIPYSISFESVSTFDPVSSGSYEHVLFAGIFDNNLYTLDEQDRLQVKYKVDFGKYNLTEQELQSDDNRKIAKLWQDGKRKTYLDRLHETDLFLGFSYLFKDKEEFCIYSKTSGTSLSSENIGNSDFISGIFVGFTDDYFVIAAEPLDVIDYLKRNEKGTERFKGLDVKEGDNPILVYYRLEKEL